MADLAVLFNQLTEARRVIRGVYYATEDDRVARELLRARGRIDKARAILAGVRVKDLANVAQVLSDREKEIAREAFAAGIASGMHFEDWWEQRRADEMRRRT